MMVTSRRSRLEMDKPNIVLRSLGLFARPFRTIGVWRQRQISRESIYRLDPNILRDVGLSEAQRFEEINKPFWEA